ncbi:putative Ulp1 protease family catalytic domain, papain-like cysteine peptidase superfamily [Helianthus annuus]|nr:uncharacterized protein LOC110890545 [Helianthus annuus]KAJ0509006.1 putative Ulp1 protease family catalytic domain, papain-like cysteine peptidase superfamily [Helianthus annuus]
MADGYVKIEVIEIYPEYKKTSLPELSCYEELEDYGDAIGHFIQWPLSSIKLSNIEATHHIPTMIQPAHENTCYSPEFEDVTEQYQIHDNHQIDMTMVENVSDEFLFGPHDVSTEHDVDGSEELDMMFSEPVEQTQASTMSKEQKRIQEALWNIEHLRPKSIKSLAERLRKHYGGETSIQLKCPTGMYPTTDSSHSYDYVEYEGVLQFLANGLLDASFIHLCQMFLYNHMRSKKENAKGKTRVAYFNTQYITGKECEKNLASVKEHLVEVYKLHKDKKYFLALFFYGGHWVLFILSPSDRKSWILDSVSIRAEKNKNHYPLTKAIETTFGSQFTWKIAKCMQQDGSWECGYLVIRNMFNFVLEKQYDFPKKIWNDTRDVTKAEIDELVKNIMTRFFREVFNDTTKK